MAAGEGDPGDGVVGLARVLGLDGALAVVRLGGVLGLAAVVLDEAVADLAAHGDGKNVVLGSVDTEEGNRGGSTVASTDLRAGNGSNGTEDVWVGGPC